MRQLIGKIPIKHRGMIEESTLPTMPNAVNVKELCRLVSRSSRFN